MLSKKKKERKKEKSGTDRGIYGIAKTILLIQLTRQLLKSPRQISKKTQCGVNGLT